MTSSPPDLGSTCIAIVGLGYVGLPLAVEFGKRYDTVGYDIHVARIDALRSGHDSTLEVDSGELASASKLTFTSQLADIAACTTYIVTVPTPIDDAKRPDLTPLAGDHEIVPGERAVVDWSHVRRVES